ncbi:MAG: hypothetical protein WD431_24370 [Cyclobacteriaceae bacterium]
MKWTQIDEKRLLNRSFILGIFGILCCLIPIIYFNFNLKTMPYGGFLNGLGLGAQLLGLSLAVLVLRKRKIDTVIKEKSKKMVLVLSVALLFFILVQ